MVSYDYEVTENLRETGAGLLVATPREFVDAVVQLGENEPARRELAAAAKQAGAALDWDVLARRYEELLDRYLPRQPTDQRGRRPRARSRVIRAAARLYAIRLWRRPTDHTRTTPEALSSGSFR